MTPSPKYLPSKTSPFFVYLIFVLQIIKSKSSHFQKPLNVFFFTIKRINVAYCIFVFFIVKKLITIHFKSSLVSKKTNAKNPMTKCKQTY